VNDDEDTVQSIGSAEYEDGMEPVEVGEGEKVKGI
jgi:hypothetical protein